MIEVAGSETIERKIINGEFDYTDEDLVIVRDNKVISTYKRHINLDGSLGGYVDDTSSADDTCYIGRDCLVYFYSKIMYRTFITDKCVVSNHVLIFDSSLNDRVCVCGDKINIINSLLSTNVVINNGPIFISNSQCINNIHVSCDTWNNNLENVIISESVLNDTITVYGHAKIICSRLKGNTRIEDGVIINQGNL